MARNFVFDDEDSAVVEKQADHKESTEHSSLYEDLSDNTNNEIDSGRTVTLSEQEVSILRTHLLRPPQTREQEAIIRKLLFYRYGGKPLPPSLMYNPIRLPENIESISNTNSNEYSLINHIKELMFKRMRWWSNRNNV